MLMASSTSTPSARVAARWPRSEAGGLRVGPRSAGARPGPACYGRGGTEATVTDANLVLGRIDPDGVRRRSDGARHRWPSAAVGRARPTSSVSARSRWPRGSLDVANSKMAQAIRTITVSQGIEPRDFALVAFGGAGPMHAVFLARELGIPETIVPRLPGAFSAWGMLQTECAGLHAGRTSGEPIDADLAEARRDCEDRRGGPQALEAEGVPGGCRAHALDMRYAAQEYTLAMPLDSAGGAERARVRQADGRAVRRRHESRYGHANLGAPIEFVALRGAAFGDLGQPAPQEWPPADGRLPPQAPATWSSTGAEDATSVSRGRTLVRHTARGPGRHRGGHRDHRGAARLRRSASTGRLA